MNSFDTFSNLKTPIYICEEELLERNLQTLADIAKRANIKILLALKGYAYFPSFSLVQKYLSGACASGLNEARLAREEINKEVHTYSPAFKAEQIREIATLSNHLVFNSASQLQAFASSAKEANPSLSLGLRVNPEMSFASDELYNPCGAHSRFGVTKKHFDPSVLALIDGLHMHALCEQNSFALEKVLEVLVEHFGEYFAHIKWLNLGGGHWLTHEDYNREHFIKTMQKLHEQFPHLQIYVEPGEAVGWQCGVLVARVLDIVENEMQIAILDTSAEAHMPDVLAMPYRPMVRGSGAMSEKKHTYRLSGNTCLSGDIIGDYSFDKPLQIGDLVVFEDMMHYSIVKNTTFNGIDLPSIAMLGKNGDLEITKTFGYNDYKNRLG